MLEPVLVELAASVVAEGPDETSLPGPVESRAPVMVGAADDELVPRGGAVSVPDEAAVDEPDALSPGLVPTVGPHPEMMSVATVSFSTRRAFTDLACHERPLA